MGFLSQLPPPPPNHSISLKCNTFHQNLVSHEAYNEFYIYLKRSDIRHPIILTPREKHGLSVCVDPIRAQSVPFLLSEISISITHIHVLFVCRSLFLVQRNPKRFLFIFHSFSPPSRSVIGAFFGHAKLLCRCVLFGHPFLALVNHSSSSHYPTQESSGCSVGTLCAWRWQTAAGRCWAAPCAPRVPFPTTCKLPAVLIPFPVLSLMLDVSANLLLSTPPRGQDSGGSAFFHLPFPLNSSSSPFLAGFPLAPASPAPKAPNLPTSTPLLHLLLPLQTNGVPQNHPHTPSLPSPTYFSSNTH